ncbi:hypothetical protein [Boudabousia marimammalium]|uniref:DUF3017 domain-containing protein n=1 Tax=Boudabousia marimammalium TaxID=156892 RepID=A0A1Q5PSE0_9ACTO|nr:hypothetical protein [Boudabousia marimammalium]OKL50352.1 hypothetical protein BM477_02935 [Boudabousia marimammalium]
MKNKRPGFVLVTSIVVVTLILVVTVALLGYPRVAVYALSAVCAVTAISRALYREPSVWFAAKDWRIDSGFFALLALGLFLLAPMANVSVN